MGSRSVFFILGLLFGLPSLVHSKHSHLSHLQKHDQIKAQREEKATAVQSNDEYLQASLQDQFSWSDPALVAHLWGGAENVPKAPFDTPSSIYGESHLEVRSLGKRGGVPSKLGPAINLNCIFCDNEIGTVFNPPVDIKEFTWEKMIERAIQPISSNTPCIFYAQRPAKPFRLEPSEDFKLSDYATEYACKNRMRSIWMIWPKEKLCGEQNYYCLFDDCCWLHPILGNGDKASKERNSLTYFQAMSKAMATTCRGEVFIMTDTLGRVPTSWFPKPVGDQELLNYKGEKAPDSIWLTHEFPVLRELYAMNKQVTKLTTISPSGVRGKDVTIALLYTEYPRKIPEVLQPTKRDVSMNEDLPGVLNLTATEPQMTDPDREVTDLTREVWHLLKIQDQIKADYEAMPEDAKPKLEGEQLKGRADSCMAALNYQQDGQDWFG